MNFKSLGRYILLIDDKPFEAVIPEVSGIVNYAVDADLEVRDRWYTVNGKNIPEVNILWFVRDMTHEIASKLDTKEQILILKDYYSGVKTVTSMIKNPSGEMKQAKNEYDDAVDNILSCNPDFSSSREASLRFAEKILKSKLQSEGKEFEGCQRLNDFAEKLDGIDIDGVKEIITEIEQLSREGGNDSPVTCEEAVKTLNNSIRLYLMLFHPSKKPGITLVKEGNRDSL